METVAPAAGLPSAPEMRPAIAEVVFCANDGADESVYDGEAEASEDAWQPH